MVSRWPENSNLAASLSDWRSLITFSGASSKNWPAAVAYRLPYPKNAPIPSQLSMPACLAIECHKAGAHQSAAAYLGRRARYRGHLPFITLLQQGLELQGCPRLKVSSHTNLPKRASPRYSCSIGRYWAALFSALLLLLSYYPFSTTPFLLLVLPLLHIFLLHLLLLLISRLLLEWIYILLLDDIRRLKSNTYTISPLSYLPCLSCPQPLARCFPQQEGTQYFLISLFNASPISKLVPLSSIPHFFKIQCASASTALLLGITAITFQI